MQQRMHVANAAEARRRAAQVPVHYVLFDLLHLDGHDLTGLPFVERRRLLERLVAPDPRWRVASYTEGDGQDLLDAADEHGLEGVMAKRLDSPYEPGRRSSAWVKVKVRRRQEFVVGGWQPGAGNRTGRLGSLALGYYDGNRLQYAGRAGSGFTAAELTRVGRLLDELATDVCPFDPPPPPELVRETHWVRPELVAEVKFGEWTEEGILRHPVYIGLRTDKAPRDVVREG
jgi:bifunctional non-homologous end joining protein LigD